MLSNNNVLMSLIKVLLNKNEPTNLKDIINEVLLDHKEENKQYIYNLLLNNKDLFSRIKRGYYIILDKEYAYKYYNDLKTKKIKNRIPINGLIVKNNSPHLHIDLEEKELNVEKHLSFIKQIAIRASNIFKLDIQDIFNEAVLLAYQHKDKYDYREGKPTTFLNNQIAPRLYNKIKRELLPNYFHTTKNEEGEKVQERVLVKEEFLYNSVKNEDDNNDVLMNYIDQSNVFKELEYDKREQVDSSYITECNEIKKIIKESFQSSGLDDNEIFCLSRRFAIDSSEEETLEDIGNKLNKTKERVRQIIVKGCKKLEKNKKLIQVYKYID